MDFVTNLSPSRGTSFSTERSNAMDMGVASVLGALIAAFGLIFQQLVASRKEQRADHGIVQEKLDNLTTSVDRVEIKVEKVEAKIDQHITDHARGVV